MHARLDRDPPPPCLPLQARLACPLWQESVSERERERGIEGGWEGAGEGEESGGERECKERRGRGRMN